MTEYKKLTDEELIRRLRMGETGIIDYLMEKYKNLVRKEANAMYLLGGETDDLIQEGMLGLWKAVRDYVPDRGASFKTFAQTCVKNSMLTAVKTAAGKHHIPLNDSVPIETLLFDRSEQLSVSDPETLYLDREATQAQLDQFYSKLSGFEAKVLDLFLNGLSYSEIADQVDRSAKSVDNAVQRIRRKLAK